MILGLTIFTTQEFANGNYTQMMNVILITSFFWVKHMLTHACLNIKKSTMVISPICSLSPMMGQSPSSLLYFFPPSRSIYFVPSKGWVLRIQKKLNTIFSTGKLVWCHFTQLPIKQHEKREEQNTASIERNQDMQGVWGQGYTEKNSLKKILSPFVLGSWASQGSLRRALLQRADRAAQSIQEAGTVKCAMYPETLPVRVTDFWFLVDHTLPQSHLHVLTE